MGAGLLAGQDGCNLEPENLRCEYLRNPLGLDERQPRFSWSLLSPARNAAQTAYQVQVAADPTELATGGALWWDSGMVLSDRTAAVRYAGRELKTGDRLWWRVRVWDQAGRESNWSTLGQWEMGLLVPGDWRGRWIARTPFLGRGKESGEALPMFRKAFPIKGTVERARLHVVGLGYHEVAINGERVGDHLLDPGFTRYDRRVLAVTHDVTGMLEEGTENVVGVMLGNGWFNVETLAVWRFDEAPWRASPRLLLQLEIDYADGTTASVCTDETWRTSAGPLLDSSIYAGEVHDARWEQAGWNRPGFDDHAWDPAVVVDAPHGSIAAQSMHPIRVTRRLPPVAVSQPRPGMWVYDFGQNLVGNAELSVSVPAGTTLSLRYGERLDATGGVDQSLIDLYVLGRDRSQRFQTDIYIARGAGREQWASRFTYHGFRYVEVSGMAGPMDASNLTARFFHTDVPDAGAFACSDPVLNRLWQNGRWSYLGNLMSIPTDCPHREKNGWTGDAHIACEQGLFYQDGITLYEKWIRDLTDEQFIDGGLPGIVPTSGQWGYQKYRGPAWDSALLMVPWYLQLYYGDDSALKRNYDRFRRYVDFLSARAHDDIVDIGLPDWSRWKTKTPSALTDTAYYHWNVQMVATLAAQFGAARDAQKYQRLADRIREAFVREFVDVKTGMCGNGSQTSIGAALYFGLVPDEAEALALAQLEAAIAESGGHLDFGHLGSKFVLSVLAEHGRAELALQLITRPTAPSYAWQIAQGATTLWEHWDGRSSLNHTFFGDVNAWLMKYIAGIRPDSTAPGFAQVIIAPQPVGGLRFAEGAYTSVRGRITTAWSRDEGHFSLRVSIPANVRGLVVLPVPSDAILTEGGRTLMESPGVSELALTERGPSFVLGSGSYLLEARWSK